MRRVIERVRAVSVLLLALAGCGGPGEDAGSDAELPDLVISNVTIVGGADGAVMTGMDVVIDDGRIVAIAGHDSARLTGETIDGSERFVIPGLIDAHTHPFPIERSFPQFLHYGVTSILVTGCGRCDDETLSELRAMGDDPMQAAPRVFHTSQHFTMEGRHPVKTYPSPAWVEGHTVHYLRDVAGIAAIVDRVTGHSNVGIKLTIEEGPAPPFVERIPAEFVNEVVRQAHERELPVFAHVSDIDELRIAQEAGVDHLLHFTGVVLDWSRDEELIADLVRREVHVVTTLMIDKSFLYPLNPDWIEAARNTGLFDEDLEAASTFGMPVERARQNAEFFYGSADANFDTSPVLRKQFADLLRLHESGVTLVTGTDVGNFYVLPGYSLHEEMALLEQGGIAPPDILQMATINAAEMLGAGDRLGAVEVGLHADLVILNSDPRDSVENISDIYMVLKGGHAMRGAP